MDNLKGGKRLAAMGLLILMICGCMGMRPMQALGKGTICQASLDRQGGVGGTGAYWWRSDTAKKVGGATVHFYADPACAVPLTGGIAIPTRKSYAFAGYFSKAGGSGIKYVDANGKFLHQLWHEAQSTTLFAHWVPTRRVTLDRQGGSGGTNEFYYIPGSSRNCQVGDKATAVRYFDDDTCANPLDTNGDSVAIPMRPGFAFGGYYTQENGVGVCYIKPDGTFQRYMWLNNTDMTLYAKWTSTDTPATKKPKVTSVCRATLDRQDGSGGTEAYWWKSGSSKKVNGQVVYYYADEGCSAPLGGDGRNIAIPTRAGYIFCGYYTQPDGSGVKYVSANGLCVNQLWLSAADATLYACWAPIRRVTLDRQAGEGGTDAYYYIPGANRKREIDGIRTKVYYFLDDVCTMPLNGDGKSVSVPTRAGYDFGGYYTRPDGQGLCYVGASGKCQRHMWENNENVTLYARWTRHSYRIDYVLDGGGLVGKAASSYTVESAVTLPEASKEGSVFLGWFSDEGKTRIVSSIPSGSTGDVTLYAKWHERALVGHRGLWQYAPANSLAGFEAAKRKGVHIVETDIRFTSDGVPVLSHDASFDVLTAKGKASFAIASHTYAQLRNAKVARARIADADSRGIATFEEALATCRELGVDLRLHLKQPAKTASAQAKRQKLDILVNLAADAGMLEHVEWFTGQLDCLRYIQDRYIARSCPVLRIIYSKAISAAALDEAQSLIDKGADVTAYCTMPTKTSAGKTVTDYDKLGSWIDQCKSRGIAFGTWQIADEHKAAEFFERYPYASSLLVNNIGGSVGGGRTGDLAAEIKWAQSICFVGDSVTAGVAKNGGHGWYERISGLDGKTVSRVAKSGLGVSGLASGKKPYLKNMQRADADLYVVAIGCNDARRQGDPSYVQTGEAYVGKLETVVKTVRKSVPNARFVFVAPWPATAADPCVKTYYHGSYDAMRAQYQAFATALEVWCKSSGHGFCDPRADIERAFAGTSASSYLVDHVHPNDEAGISLYSSLAMGW